MKVMTIVMFVVVIGSTIVRAVRNYKVNKFAKKQHKEKEERKKAQSDAIL